MKPTRFALIAALMSLTPAAFAQSDAQKTFEKLKTLAGSWEGPITSTPPYPEIEGKQMNVTFRVTSMGNTLMHEMTGAGRPDDPITMLYLDAEDQLSLTHYCDAGNRPRMIGKLSPDGKSAEFHSVHVDGSKEYGHMHGAVFTFIDENHHSEEWTYMLPGDKPTRARVNLKRTGALKSANSTPTVSERGALLTDLESTYGGVRKIIAAAAEKMPESKYAFRPAATVRTFGEIVGHVADAQYAFCSIVRGEKNPGKKIEKTVTTKADLLAELQDAFTYCETAYSRLSDAAAVEQVKFMGGDKPRLGVLTTNSLHAVEHYGNLVTYMRMNDLVPPTSDPEFMRSLQKK